MLKTVFKIHYFSPFPLNSSLCKTCTPVLLESFVLFIELFHFYFNFPALVVWIFSKNAPYLLRTNAPTVPASHFLFKIPFLSENAILFVCFFLLNTCLLLFLKQISYTGTVPMGQVPTHFSCPNLTKGNGSIGLVDTTNVKLNNHFYFINIICYAFTWRSKKDHLQGHQ